MNQRKIIVIAIIMVLVAGAVVSYSLLPRKYQQSQHLTQAVAFWNDKEAFLFLTTTANGRSSNAVQEKLSSTKYGFWLTLVDPPAAFYRQQTAAYHLLASGQLDRFTLPEQTAQFGRWTLHDGNLELIPPGGQYGKLNGFRWNGEKFIAIAQAARPESSATRSSTLTADDDAQEDEEDSGLVSKADRSNFKEAGWHYKQLPTYAGETNEATLPLALDGSAFNIVVRTFPLARGSARNFSLTEFGVRNLELTGDRLAQPATVLWSQQGWKEISQNEYQAQFQKFGHAPARPVRLVLWLFILLFLFLWKFAAWGHLLFAFGGVKKKVLQNLPTGYSFPPVAPTQFPMMDSQALDRYTRDLEFAGFTRLTDFSLTPDRGNQPPSFCRLFANVRYHCFAEVHQMFPRGKQPMPMRCSLLSILQDGWTISFSDRKPLAASSLIRRKRALGVSMPDSPLREMMQAFLKMRDQVCMELGISPLTDDTLEAYCRQVHRALGEMREAVQQKSFAIGVPQVYLRKLSMLKTKPEYIWLGDYPKEAEQRKQGYVVPAEAH